MPAHWGRDGGWLMTLRHQRWPVTLALATGLFLAIFAHDLVTVDSPFRHLYYLPIILVAIRFGFPGGVGAAILAVGLHHLANSQLMAFKYGEADIVQSVLFFVVAVVTARITADVDLLRASETRYRRLFETAKDGILILERESGVVIAVNPSLVAMLGRAREELVGRPLWELESFRDLAASEAEYDTMRQPELVRHDDLSLVTRDGHSVEVEFVASAFVAASRSVIQCNIRDVTARKRAETRVAYLNRLYMMLSAVNEAIVRERDEHVLGEAVCRIAVETGGFRMAWIGMVDPAGRMVTPVASAGVIDGYLDVVRIDLADAIRSGGPVGRCVHSGEDQVLTDIATDPVMAPWREAALLRGYRSACALPIRVDDRVVGSLVLYADRPRAFDAEEIALLDQLAMDVGFALGVNRRETERQHLEVQLHQAQKMEAIGRLAAGVAHDFNNLLFIVLGNVDLVMADLPADDPHRGDLAAIREAAGKAAGLTRQLLAFSRKQIIQPAMLDMNVAVAEMRKMLERLIGEDVAVVVQLHDGPVRVTVDRGQLEQVIMNLAVNARDAMPRGGRLTLTTAMAELDARYAASHVDVTPGTYGLLTVTDTGTGMTPEVRQRIFEPFFTTKGVGKGTGLGLATVYGIVKQSGGTVEVASEPGKGTSFNVYLPRADATEAVAPVAAPPSPPARPATILVVEDAEALRALIRRLLKRQGYDVLLAANAEEAFPIFEEHPAIDLVLTDVVMPGTSGPELARLLLARRPGLKVIYMSGYTDDAIVHHGILSPGIAFLHKPFTAEALGRKIREALEGDTT